MSSWPRRIHGCERRGSNRPHAGRNRAPGGPDPGPSARADHGIAGRRRGRLGRRVCRGRKRGVAIELDGDPARQDLDYALAERALDAGCLFALDSDAHTTAQLCYAETAIAHARFAAIPSSRIVNCWPLDRLLTWLDDPSSEAQG